MSMCTCSMHCPRSTHHDKSCCENDCECFCHKPEPKPPASEGVRLSVDEAIFKIEDYVGGNIEGVDTIDRMSFTRFLRQTLESLAALPELERVECYMPAHKWPDNDPKKCYQCKGTGEVWVRKDGV